MLKNEETFKNAFMQKMLMYHMNLPETCLVKSIFQMFVDEDSSYEDLSKPEFDELFRMFMRGWIAFGAWIAGSKNE